MFRQRRLLAVGLTAAVCLTAATSVRSNVELSALLVPDMRLFQGDGDVDLLATHFTYRVVKTGRIIDIPAGFVTDYASVPAAARWLIDRRGLYSVPAVVHDFLYWDQRCTKDQADLLLYDAMGEYKVPQWKRWFIYHGVQLGGGGPWATNASERKNGLPRIVPAADLNIPPNAKWASYRQMLFNKGVRAEPAPAPGVPPPEYCTLS